MGKKGFTLKGILLILAFFGAGLLGIVIGLNILRVLDSDSKNVLVQKAEENVKNYRLEELEKGHLFRVVGLVGNAGRYRGFAGARDRCYSYDFGNSLAEGLKELGKRYQVIDIKEISGNFGVTITKDLLVFVEPLNKGG